MTERQANSYNLVADIGGTNTRIALSQNTQVLPATVRRYRNADFAGLESVIRRFCDDEGNVDPHAACVAVAGPVRHGRAAMTNLDWTIDTDTLARAAQSERVAILNDLQAQGHALGHIDPQNLREILPGAEAGPEAAKLVIGVGTGFNAAPVFETARGRVVTASESGHANLPIRTEQELRLCQYVSTAHGFPAVEDVLSGRGLERVYAFLGQDANDTKEKPAQDIMASLSTGDDERAASAARIFARLLGTVAGNLALIQLPFGGVFLAGGVARAFGPYLSQFGFMSNFPVTIIEDDYAALTGCASYLKELDEHR